MILSWIILIIGSEIALRTDSVRQFFPLIRANKVRFKCLFLSWVASLVCFWLNSSHGLVWIVVLMALLILSRLNLFLRLFRHGSVNEKSLRLLDQIILQMKAGLSFRRALQNEVSAEKSWYSSFALSLLRSLEGGRIIETESKWFNRWSQELIQIDQSRNRTIEQIEVLRRYTRQEIHLKRRLKNASAGPRAQFIMMTTLFLALNVWFLNQRPGWQIQALAPIAWCLYFMGAMTTFFIMRSFRWKV
jgi:hypothetical protein